MTEHKHIYRKNPISDSDPNKLKVIEKLHIGNLLIEKCNGCKKGEIVYTWNGGSWVKTKGVDIACKNGCGVYAQRCSYGCSEDEVKNGWDCGTDGSGMY